MKRSIEDSPESEPPRQRPTLRNSSSSTSSDVHTDEVSEGGASHASCPVSTTATTCSSSIQASQCASPQPAPTWTASSSLAVATTSFITTSASSSSKVFPVASGATHADKTGNSPTSVVASVSNFNHPGHLVSTDSSSAATVSDKNLSIVPVSQTQQTASELGSETSPTTSTSVLPTCSVLETCAATTSQSSFSNNVTVSSGPTASPSEPDVSESSTRAPYTMTVASPSLLSSSSLSAFLSVSPSDINLASSSNQNLTQASDTLLTISSDSSPESSNDSVGVVPVTFSSVVDVPHYDLVSSTSVIRPLNDSRQEHMPEDVVVDISTSGNSSDPLTLTSSSLLLDSDNSNLHGLFGSPSYGDDQPEVPQVEQEQVEYDSVERDPAHSEEIEPEIMMLEDPSTAILTSGPLCIMQREPLAECGVLSREEERKLKEELIFLSGKVPAAGETIPKGQLRRAGPYLLGPRLGSSPVRSIVQCLARRENTDEFYTLKILTVRDTSDENQDDRQGKMLLHTEHSLLSLLSGQKGVIQHHGLFQDYAVGVHEPSEGRMVATGGLVRRVCLVLDCVTAHDYCQHTADLINLQHYVITKEKLSERDALTIFYNIVSVVHSLHEQNIVHRDLKLGNLVLHRATREVTITNFCLGQHLPSEQDRLRDQRGSPAYISPDVLSGKPYLGKPSDMWALGVVLFTMLYGHFPFYDALPQELFRKIKAAQYVLPKGDKRVTEGTKDLIRGLLVLDPLERFNCSQVLGKLTALITPLCIDVSCDDQIVPELEEKNNEKPDKNHNSNPNQSSSNATNNNTDQGFGNSITRTRRPAGRDGDSQSLNIDVILQQLEDSHINKPKSSTSKTISTSICSSSSSGNRNNGVISCIVGDARPLTQAELSEHRHLLPHTTRIADSVSRSSGPPPSVTVVVSRNSNDRFSSILSLRSSGIRNFPLNPLGPPPSSSHSQHIPNMTIPPSPLPPHVLSSRLSVPMSLMSGSSPRLPPSSPRPLQNPLLTSNSSGPLQNPLLTSNGSGYLQRTFSGMNQSQSQTSVVSHPIPPTGSRSRWAPGVHSRIVHNISSLQHSPSNNNIEVSDQNSVGPRTVENGHAENDNESASSSSSSLPRRPFHLVLRPGRGRAQAAKNIRPYRPVRRNGEQRRMVTFPSNYPLVEGRCHELKEVCKNKK
ncbi:uncharacterized protein [Palaemon carinicauda]|uniref:uncharacterized protein n=1 Tax=Palaemon carinicauda TaxID=392227 RepID=UPI0035B69CA2